MSPSLVLASFLATAAVTPAARTSTAAPTLARLPLPQRCALARLLASQVREMLAWVDRDKIVSRDDFLAEGRLDLAIFLAPEAAHSLLAAGESCQISLPPALSPNALEVRVAAGCPPALAKPYAMLFGKEVVRGRRWEFVWALNQRLGGCNEPLIGPSLSTMLTPAPKLRLTVERTKSEFTTVSASLELTRWSEPIPAR